MGWYYRANISYATITNLICVLVEHLMKTIIAWKAVLESNNSGRKNTRKRKVIWFNPRYSMNVEINIGKTFLKLVKKHFPSNNSFHKIFNKNTIKISYSCMRNISSIIASHKSILRPKATEYGCNCRHEKSKTSKIHPT